MKLTDDRRLAHDWHHGSVPGNVVADPTACIETAYCFLFYRSRAAVGLFMDAGSAVYGVSLFDTGPNGRIRLGKCTMLNGVWIVCDDSIDIGNYTLISWNVVLMDSYRQPPDPLVRRMRLEQAWRDGAESGDAMAKGIRIGDAVWIGFESVVLPGVTIGDGAVIGCRSVVTQNVPPYTVVAGNPARIVRRQPGSEHM